MKHTHIEYLTVKELDELRNDFAAKAMQTLLASSTIGGYREIATAAYLVADVMLTIREEES